MAVIDNAFETKGTNVFFYDSPTMYTFSCPTGVTGVKGGTKDRIDTTCLSNTGSKRTYIGGFSDSSEQSVPFILYKGSASHLKVMELDGTGEVVPWFVGLSDSTDAPTGIDTDGLIVPPAGRSGFLFTGYIASITIDIATNEVVRGTMTIQPSGDTTYVEGA